MRSERLDALRALAMVWMTVFHLGFDLAYFGWWIQDFYHDPLWTTQRVLIVSLFLFCAGASQALALHQGQTWRAFGRRWLEIAGCALLVSLGSRLMFPDSFIYFGVLHAIAVMLLALRLAASLWRGGDIFWWLAGAMAVALGAVGPALIANDPRLKLLDGPGLNWIGLISAKPRTEDYVPLLPWLGPLLWGYVSMRYLLRRRSHWVFASVRPVVRPLARLGTWSLLYYMVHQPVMIGLLLALQQLS